MERQTFLNLLLCPLLLFITIVLFIWLYFQNLSNYWKKRGVPYMPYSKCLALHFADMMSPISPNIHNAVYDAMEGHSYVGFFEILKPAILLRDPTMVKGWLVKGFSSFHDHPSDFAPEDDGKNLTGELMALRGEKWWTVRTKFAPAFSSAKLKVMYQIMRKYAAEVNEQLERIILDKDEAEVDIKNFTKRYMMDVIGACAVGIECNAIKDPQNCDILNYADRVIPIGWRRKVYKLLDQIHPKLPTFLGLSFRYPEVIKFMTSLTQELLETKKLGNQQQDFIRVLINSSVFDAGNKNGSSDGALEEKLKTSKDTGFKITAEYLAGIVAASLASGLEPNATALVCCLHELSKDSEIQNRVFDEVRRVKHESAGEITFEDLKKLQYLDQVVKETFRKYNLAVGHLNRECREPFKIPNTSRVVETGIRLNVPLFKIQNDEKYFPKPERFEPERFSEDNIHKIVPGSYLPFGEGPRFCIANRFVLMEIKTMIVSIVSDYSIYPCTRNQVSSRYYQTSPVRVGELWLQLRKRA